MPRLLVRAALLCYALQLVLVNTQCVRDSYSSLPGLPGFPTASFSGTVRASSSYVQDHWSDVAKMLRPTNTIVSTQTGCPHLGAGLLDWHNADTWGGQVPQNGADVTLPENTKVLLSSCSVNPTWVFGIVTIPATSELIFGDAEISFHAHGIHVIGSLLIGSPTCRLRNKVTLTLHGKRPQTLPAIEYVKGIYVEGVIDVHGVEFFPTWTRLSATANPGDQTIFIQDCPNWQAGQKVVITTTEVKDARDWHRNEELIIQKVEKTSISSTVCAVTFTAPLAYQHYGGFEYQAEVGLLTRNILIQGDPVNSEPTDVTPIACKYGTSPSTYPCENTFLTGFGVHVMVAFTATTGRFSGVEVFRGGQTNVLGRYPIHFHMLGTLTTPNKFWVSDTAVHRSFFRCYTIHGTSGNTVDNGIMITKSIGYDAIGHCFFASEDGVEENHVLSYNLAAHVHPLGPYWQASEGITQGAFSTGTQSFYSQYTATVTSNPNLVLADDISGSAFYFTNANSKIIGNAASGGWAGFAFPNLPAPKGFFRDVKNFVPKNRPTLLFQGNSAHSTGFWQSHAAGVYLGGNLRTDVSGNTIYTAGRFLPARDSCTDSTFGSSTNTAGCPADKRVWLQFYDTKIFLSNIGLQSWGDRSELIRFEVHDVQLSTNVFGQVWIDQMAVNCRTKNTPVYLSGCTNPTQWWLCNARDQAFFRSFGGFQFYDTGQSHIVTNSKFTNCQSATPTCTNGKCSIKIFEYLTHSDQYTPGLMQLTKNITYVNTEEAFLMVPSTSSAQSTVAGRDASWRDEDGSVTKFFPGERVNIGSNWAGPDWWRYNDRCQATKDNWVCPMSPGDSAASMRVHWDKPNESNIGTSFCSNGPVNGAYLPCPIGAHITHFGRSEANSFPVALMPRATGPIIAASGGWFIRYTAGTPNLVTFNSIQVDHDDILHVAIPYPMRTTFAVYAQAPTWCNPGTAPYQSWNSICRHDFRAVSSVSEVRAAWGDAYFYDSATQLLHVRIVSMDSFSYQFATYGTKDQNAIWTSTSMQSKYFARGGTKLLVTGSEYWSVNIQVTSGNCSPTCVKQPEVTVPPAMPFGAATCASLPSIPNSEAGTCTTAQASGTTCIPVCKTGYSGTLSATCTAGVWASSGVCVVTCTTTPTVANGNAGDCKANSVVDTKCVPVCNTGYSGTLSATCSSTGTWTVFGSCSSLCSGLPTIPNAAGGNCVAGSTANTMCTPTCNAGYIGTLSATCTSTGWTTTGSCTKICTVLPTVNNAVVDTCANTASGSYCTPTCVSGTTGTVSALCNVDNTWTISGSCVSTACTVLPPIPDSLAGDCTVPTASGQTCTPVCKSGFMGSLSSLCENTNWTSTGSCASTTCTTIPSAPDASVGDCVAPSASGTTCTPACNAGFSGSVSATCTNAIWTITGSCSTTACTTLPPAIQDASVGDCKTPTASGVSCTPVCNSGFSGVLSAYCSGGAWSVSGTCTNTDCTSLPVVRDADAGDCKIPTASGVTCTPTCKADFTGTLAAQCNQGAWLTSGSCTSTACANPPSLVNAAVGDCVIPSSSGTTCVPVCNSGFFGDLSASCSNTVWTVVGECKSTSCALVPFIQDAGNGDCVANAASGTTCTPVCNTGFAGTLSATCTSTTWTTTGSCKAVCPAAPTITDGAAGDCAANTVSGTQCVPVCNTGYTGTLSATCTDSGTWSVTGSCVGSPCAGTPQITDSSAGNCVAGAAHGTTCTPVCNQNFAGTLSATCTTGTWVTSGACAIIGGQPCATMPSVTNASVGDCKANTPSGTTCTPVCDAGFSGTVTATCSSGAWSYTGICASTACATLFIIADATAGDCQVNSASGTICTPACNTGFAGTLSAKCENTQWTTTGVCTSTSCRSLPVVPNAAAGDCTVDMASGTTCSLVCNPRFTGTVTATCTDTAWTTAGSCTSTTCATLPNVANAAAGDCTIGALAGTICTPVCNTGFNGPVSAECMSSAWVISGSCTPLLCATLPVVENGVEGDCKTNSPSETVCTPSCNSGFAGSISATCTQGAWTVSGVCASIAGPACTTLPTVQDASTDTCFVGTASGAACIPVCNPGFKGQILATCSSGAWTVTGSCVSTKCSDLPLPPNSEVGNCVSGAASGSSCVPVCVAGYTAACTDAMWTITGACGRATCPSLPALEGADAGDCVAGSTEGTTCTPVCTTGFEGTLSASCASASWTVTGVCVNTGCSALPSITNANPGNCQTNMPSGSSCEPTCFVGYNGTIIASCAHNTWSIEGSCVIPKVPEPEPQLEPQPEPEPGTPDDRRWNIEVQVILNLSCDELNSVLADLNKWLVRHYNEQDVEVILVMQIRECNNITNTKRQAEAWSDVSLQGILAGPDASYVAPEAVPTVESYFAQSEIAHKGLRVTSSEVTDRDDGALSLGAIIGIVIGALAILILLAVVILLARKNSQNSRMEIV